MRSCRAALNTLLLLFALVAAQADIPDQQQHSTQSHNSTDRQARRLARRAHAHEHAHNRSREASVEPNAGTDESAQGDSQSWTQGSEQSQSSSKSKDNDTEFTETNQAQSYNEGQEQKSRHDSGGSTATEEGGGNASPSHTDYAQQTTFGSSSVKVAAMIPRDQFTWDGENSWEWDYPRTMYFEPVAGLGNRLRALASAVVLAKEYGAGLKVIWRLEAGCGDGCGNPGFNSTWPDLFSEPRLRLVDNFPGSTYNSMEELGYLRAVGRDELTPPLKPGQCLIHYPRSHHEMKDIMERNWTTVSGEEILCVKSDLWLTEAGEKEGKFFFRLLKPSATVQAMIDTYKYETEWEENHMVGIHVRRGDLTIYGKNDLHKRITSLIPIESYVEVMKKQKELASGVKRVRFFLATDDEEAENAIKAAFKPGYVMTYKKTQRDRLAVEGIQQALVDVMLLADCPVLIGTYYSSYSETAKMMGWPFYIQVGHALKALSIETVVEKEDPEEEELARRRLIEYDMW